MKKWSIVSLMTLLLMGAAMSAQATNYVSGQSSVDSGEIRWGGSTQYTWERDDAILTWNNENPINIAPDTVWTVEDLTFSDVNCGCYPWSGAWQPNTGADSLFLNLAYMPSNYDNRRHVVTHELGHALGLAHSVSGNVMYNSAYQYTLGSQDLTDYHYLWGY